MMLPIFNEHKYAINMNNGASNNRAQTDKRNYTKSELVIYTKWLYWNIFGNDAPDQRIQKTKNGLINFCKQLLLHFNEDNDYHIIEYCLNKARNEKLRSCNPSYISHNEWQQIMSINDEIIRKTYFACLVLAKFYRNNPIEKNENSDSINYSDTRLRINYHNEKDILKYAGIKFSNKNKKENYLIEYWPLMYLVQNNFIEPKYYYKKQGQNVALSLILSQADSQIDDSQVYLKITDYDNIMEYYNYGMQVKGYKVCAKCGSAFKTKSCKNNDKYCSECLGYNVLPIQYNICLDCGKRISYVPGHNQPLRCKNCQHRRNNEKKLKYKKASI